MGKGKSPSKVNDNTNTGKSKPLDVELTFVLFFDGTLNSKVNVDDRRIYTDEEFKFIFGLKWDVVSMVFPPLLYNSISCLKRHALRKKMIDSASYSYGYSNIARLYSCFNNENKKEVIPIYIEGVGTKPRKVRSEEIKTAEEFEKSNSEQMKFFHGKGLDRRNVRDLIYNVVAGNDFEDPIEYANKGDTKMPDVDYFSVCSDDEIGATYGFGDFGIKAKVERAVFEINKQILAYFEENNIKEDVNSFKLKFIVYGSGRGAASARCFCSNLKKKNCKTEDENINDKLSKYVPIEMGKTGVDLIKSVYTPGASATIASIIKDGVTPYTVSGAILPPLAPEGLKMLLGESTLKGALLGTIIPGGWGVVIGPAECLGVKLYQKHEKKEKAKRYLQDENSLSISLLERFEKDGFGKYVSNPDVSVEFLGLFDTISAYGLDYDLRDNVKELSLDKKIEVKNVFQICAADEFEFKLTDISSYGKGRDSYIILPGRNRDIGGGNSSTFYSLIPFDLMKEKSISCCGKNYFNSSNADQYQAPFKTSKMGKNGKKVIDEVAYENTSFWQSCNGNEDKINDRFNKLKDFKSVVDSGRFSDYYDICYNAEGKTYSIYSEKQKKYFTRFLSIYCLDYRPRASYDEVRNLYKDEMEYKINDIRKFFMKIEMSDVRTLKNRIRDNVFGYYCRYVISDSKHESMAGDGMQSSEEGIQANEGSNTLDSNKGSKTEVRGENTSLSGETKAATKDHKGTEKEGTESNKKGTKGGNKG